MIPTQDLDGKLGIGVVGLGNMNDDKSNSSVYVNRLGLTNRITTFRCNTILRDRLFAYAESVNRDPSEIIREAIAEYLRNRNNIQNRDVASGWSAKSTNL